MVHTRTDSEEASEEGKEIWNKILGKMKTGLSPTEAEQERCGILAAATIALWLPWSHLLIRLNFTIATEKNSLSTHIESLVQSFKMWVTESQRFYELENCLLI